MKREFGVEVRLPSNDEDISTKKRKKRKVQLRIGAPNGPAAVVAAMS